MSESLSSSTSRTSEHRLNRAVWPLLFLIIAVIGLFYVKWSPYYAKAFTAAAKHSIGDSILTGKLKAVPVPSVSSALGYMAGYFKAVWKAVILGLTLGSLVQVLIPRKWIAQTLGKTSLSSTAAAGAAALPGMMCSCCAAPLAVGLRKRSASVNAALAFFLANPVLNPATIIFMGFVLSWKFAIFRVAAGLVMVLGISTLAARFANSDESLSELGISAEDPEETGPLSTRWLKALGQLIIETIPAYLIVVALLGAFRAWLFPALGSEWAGGILALILLSVTGTLFVIPTAAEIPIVQSLMTMGLGVGPAAALLLTLPAVSLPSLLILKRAFSARVLIFVAAAVMFTGIIGGLTAMVIF